MHFAAPPHAATTGCNEITDSGLWTSLIPRLESLTVLDCINVADETVAAITQMLPALTQLNLQVRATMIPHPTHRH